MTRRRTATIALILLSLPVLGAVGWLVVERYGYKEVQVCWRWDSGDWKFRVLNDDGDPSPVNRIPDPTFKAITVDWHGIKRDGDWHYYTLCSSWVRRKLEMSYAVPLPNGPEIFGDDR